MRVNRQQIIAGLPLGIVTVFLQLVLLREILFIFKGLEFSLGVCLFIWLAGSTLGASLKPPKRAPSLSLFKAYLIFFTTTLISFIAISLTKFSNPLIFYTRHDLPFLLFWGCILIFPVSFSLGLIFPAIVHTIFPANGQSSGVLRIYLLETIGSAFGGIALYFYLLQYAGHQQIIFLSLLLFGFSGFVLLKNHRRIMLFILTLFALLSFLTPRIFSSLKSRMELDSPPQTYWTPYGRLDVIEQNGLYSFLHNGNILGIYANPYTAELNYLMPHIMANSPQKMLLIGGNPFLLSDENLRFTRTDTVIWVEPNRFLPYIYASITDTTHSTRLSLKVYQETPRTFLAANPHEKFQLIVMDVLPPSTLAYNSFYTRQFFTLVQEALTETGLFYFTTPSSENFLTTQSIDFINLIKNTAESVFEYVEILPGNETIFFCTNTPPPHSFRQKLLEQSNWSGWQPLYLDRYYWRFRLSPERVLSFNSALNGKPAPLINTDNNFIGFLLFCRTLPLPTLRQLTELAALMEKWKNWTAAIIIFIICLIYIMPRYPTAGGSCISGLVVNGLLCMALETLALLLFQMQRGSIYLETALFFSGFMGGMALGVAATPQFRQDAGKMRILQSGYFVNALLLVLLANLDTAGWPQSMARISFTLIFVYTGFLGGSWFGVLSDRYFTHHKNSASGRSYAWDLLGAALGSVLFIAFLLPILGMNRFLTTLCVLNLVLWRAAKPN